MTTSDENLRNNLIGARPPTPKVEQLRRQRADKIAEICAAVARERGNTAEEARPEAQSLIEDHGIYQIAREQGISPEDLDDLHRLSVENMTEWLPLQGGLIAKLLDEHLEIVGQILHEEGERDRQKLLRASPVSLIPDKPEGWIPRHYVPDHPTPHAPRKG